MKAAYGRGRKSAAWTTALYEELSDDFRQVRRAGVKLNLSVVKCMALRLISKATVGSKCYLSDKYPRSGRPIQKHVDTKFIQRFCEVEGIVTRQQTGKFMQSAAKKLQIDVSEVRPLYSVKHDFYVGLLNEYMLYNINETAFHINMYDGKTLE